MSAIVPRKSWPTYGQELVFNAPDFGADTPTGHGGAYGRFVAIINADGTVAQMGGGGGTVAIDQTTPGTTNNVSVSASTGAGAAIGAAADAAVAAGAAGTLSAKLRRISQGLEDLKTLVVLAGGSNVVGRFGIDQTTPGTTNAVAVATQVGAANLANAQVTADSTAGGVTLAAARATRRTVTLVNHGTADVYVGSGTVSAANGVLLLGVRGASVTLAVAGAVKGYCATTSVVGVAEEFD